MELLEIDEIQATAILDLQLRRLAALERQRIIDEATEIEARDRRPQRHPGQARPAAADHPRRDERDRRQVRRRAPHPARALRRRRLDEDLIAREDVVVTITRTGYAKRTKTDLYRAQRRGGKGVQGAALKADDIVAHFFVSSTHDWILFFTNKGRVYRAKAYELPEANRNARGQHVANLLAFQPDETIAEVITLKNYEVAPYLVLATKHGLVKKTRLTDFDSNRTGGIVAINLREDDELIDAAAHLGRRRPAAGQPAAPCRSGSTPTTRRCGRWAGRPPASSGCGSTAATSCWPWRWSATTSTASKSWSPLRAATPSGPRSTSTRCRAEAARAC